MPKKVIYRVFFNVYAEDGTYLFYSTKSFGNLEDATNFYLTTIFEYASQKKVIGSAGILFSNEAFLYGK